MSPRNGFDRFMVDLEVGHNLKLSDLTPGERYVFLAGVLPIAAKSPIRGALMIGKSPATAAHVARQAETTVKMAGAALEKLRAADMLELDPDLGAEWVHDFEDWNPPPKRDNTAAERQRRHRENARKSANVTSVSRRDSHDGHARDVENVTPTEEKRKEETPLPPDGGTKRPRLKSVPNPDAYPDDLAVALHSTADAVVVILQRVAAAMGAKVVTRAAVGRALVSFPGRDHVEVASDVEHYWVFGQGAGKKRHDAVLTYRNRLSTSAVVQSTTAAKSDDWAARMNAGPTKKANA